MSKTPDIIDMEFLTPGSVWRNSKQKQSRFLFATNMHLPDRLQEDYPPMAVYADADNNILSVPLEDFLAKREFFIVDGELETRLNNLLNTDESDEEFHLDGDDGDTLLIEDGDDSELISGDVVDDSNPLFGLSMDEEIVPSGSEAAYQVTYSAEGTGLPEVISPRALSTATEGYSQEPMIQEQKIKHTLFVRAGEGINQDTLRRSFSPDQAEINAIYTFRVMTDEGTVDVDWDTFVGVYPMIRGTKTLYQLIFTTYMPMHYEVPAAPVPEVAAPAPTQATEVVVALGTASVTSSTVVAALNPVPAPVAPTPTVQVAAAPTPVAQAQIPATIAVVPAPAVTVAPA